MIQAIQVLRFHLLELEKVNFLYIFTLSKLHLPHAQYDCSVSDITICAPEVITAVHISRI